MQSLSQHRDTEFGDTEKTPFAKAAVAGRDLDMINLEAATA